MITKTVCFNFIFSTNTSVFEPLFPYYPNEFRDDARQETKDEMISASFLFRIEVVFSGKAAAVSEKPERQLQEIKSDETLKDYTNFSAVVSIFAWYFQNMVCASIKR